MNHNGKRAPASEQKPKWERLRAMVEDRARRENLLLEDQESPDLVAISTRAHLSRGYLHGVFNKRNKPKWHNLIKLALSFKEDPSEWLDAGGFDPAGPPPEALQLERRVFEMGLHYAPSIADQAQVDAAVERGQARLRAYLEAQQDHETC